MHKVNKYISKFHNFTNYIRRLQPVFEELKKVFEFRGKPFLAPEPDITTRWNSTYNMIIKLQEIREMIDILVA
ncbi:13193_t:CDS:1, partial [Acaulospora morrowiae]